MESLPNSIQHPADRVIPLPVALYESNGLLFELYDGGQPYQPMVIRWERLQPVLRKDDIKTNQKERSTELLQAGSMKMTDFLSVLRQCFHQELAAKTGWGTRRTESGLRASHLQRSRPKNHCRVSQAISDVAENQIQI